MTNLGTNKRHKVRPAITSDERIQQRDFKLWEREKAQAIASKRKVISCQCTLCMGSSTRTILGVQRHLKQYGRYHRSRNYSGQFDRDSSDEEWAASAYGPNKANSNNMPDAPGLGLHYGGIDFTNMDSVGQRPTGYDFTTTNSASFVQNSHHDFLSDPLAVDSDTRFQEMIYDIFHTVDEAVDDHTFQGESFEPNVAEEMAGDAEPIKLNGIHVEKEPLAGFAEAFKPLYEGSKESILEFTLLLVNLCTEHRVPQVFVNALLSLLKKKVLPQPNNCPPNWYHAKGLIKLLGFNYHNIDACMQGCVLFRKEHADLLQCPECNGARYKENTMIPVNRVRWFPLIPRLQRMFRCPSISELLTWAPEHKSNVEMVHHVADSRQWKLIDELYPAFAKESRNLCFALMLDGVNPFQLQSVKHSMWPIMLVNYNLPPWLATKRFFVMLSILISGSKSITQENVDVYLQPLYEELDQLWLPGVDAYDCHARRGDNQFKLHAMLIWTINDYPALGYIAGLRTGGNRSCVVCGGAKPAERANCLFKSVHLDHRMWLPADHVWRTEAFAEQFNGLTEDREAPQRQSAAHIQEKGKEKQTFDQSNVGKKNNPADPYILHGVKRRSALFNLPYWEHLPVRHCLDVMHLEKNVCESLVGFLLGSKDTKAVRDDLQARGIRPELWPVIVANKQKQDLPQAPYTFTEVERDIFMRRLKRIKAPDGYCGNWESKVELGPSGRHHKLFGLKSHDYHVLMQQILPMCIRGLLSNEVRSAIISLSSIFKRLCQKNFDPSLYPQLHKDTIETLCRLEMTLPPAFFDVMTHLLVHAVEELEWCGPVHTRWMYFGERALAHFTRYSQTRANVGGSIAACYVREEALGYMTEYMSGMNAYRRRVWDEEEELEVSGEVLKGKATPVTLTESELQDMHNYVLQNHPLLEPWRKTYEDLLKETQLPETTAFPKWVQEEIAAYYMEHPLANPDLLYLSRTPSRNALTYKHMWAYGSHYRVKDDYDQPRATYDAGVSGFFHAPLFPGSDATAEVQYVGELTHIVQMFYKTKQPVVLLKAQWVRPHDPSRHPSFKHDDDGLLHVNFKQLLPESQDSFVLPAAIHQVFFLEHESRTSGWRVVMTAEPRSRRIFDIQEDCVAEG